MKKSYSERIVVVTVFMITILGFWGIVAAEATAAPNLFESIPADRLIMPEATNEALAKIKQDKTTIDVNVVTINPSVFNEKKINLNVPMAAPMEAETAEISRRGPNDFTWVGKFPQPAGDAIMVVKNGQVTGSIRAGTALYRVWPLGEGKHAVVQVDQSKFPPEHPPSFEKIQPGTLPPQKEKGDQQSTGPTPITVLVAYTPAAEAKVLGPMDSFIQLAVTESNQSYQNSKINLTLVLAGIQKVNYQESGSFDTDLDNFKGMTDGAMDEIHSLRDQKKADVCVLIVDNNQYCGLAAAILAKPETAFAVVYFKCATGYYSFAHEIGHLQGARHNLEMDPTLQPFPYGHGYYLNPKWRTIMSYANPCNCPRIQYWSNPNVQYEGVPMGTSERNNNARVLNETAAYVSGFRQ
ncbi:MAG TPA: M12 family metallo-peptidase [Desulfomonilaceae bacterium]|nr:M12 family metallo-peptidase [Desulfomonilaceae bacterium]